MAKQAPKPFRFRDNWRAQVTILGKRVTKDFPKGDWHEANAWIQRQREQGQDGQQPQLGGPSIATLAEALHLYAGLYTINKNGFASEINRINHYLEGAGIAPLKIVTGDGGARELQHSTKAALPSAFQAHADRRRASRSDTYERIAELAKKRCSAISTLDLRRLMSEMSREGLSDSTVQKEIALLKHVFNVAAAEWNWKDFPNPCVGLKLGKSKMRFVSMTDEEKQRIRNALHECDNPYFWPFVEVAMETSLRRGSVLALRWDQVDLEGRFVFADGKTGQESTPLSQRAVAILNNLPRDSSGLVFPITKESIRNGWNGVREKVGLPTLQLKDLRHLAPTHYARKGLTAHHIQRVLGHKSTKMAEVYVNLANPDVLDAMDRAAADDPMRDLPPPMLESAAETMRRKRVQRLQNATAARLQQQAEAA